VIKIFGSDKKKYKFLLKNVNKDDIRKESRFINFVQFINELIDQEKTLQVKQFKMDTFQIIPLSKRTSLVEWLPNTSTIKHEIEILWEEQ